MSDQLESMKTTIKDHPTETAAVVGAVGALAALFYFNSKEKDARVRIAKAQQIGWFSRYLEYRTVRAQLKLATLTK